MQKLLLALLTFTFSLSTLSAQHLTNRQVYDFNVGDIFETRGCSGGCTGPYLYQLTIILKKWTSVTTDTIYYADSLVSYMAPSCMTCSAYFSDVHDTMRITNLDSLTTPNPIPSCDSALIKDTVYYDSVRFCGRRIWQRQTPNDTTYNRQCGETEYAAYVVEGCGGSYGGWFDPSVPDGQTNDLIYYKKGTDSCGSYYQITGINDLKPQEASIKLFPNPNNGKFNLSISNEELGMNSRVEIYNVLGEKVYTNQFTIYNPDSYREQFTIDITNQPSGVYFVRLLSDKTTQVIKVVKE